MTQQDNTVCKWIDLVTRSLESVIPDDEMTAIAQHLSECLICRTMAESGGDEKLAQHLHRLDEIRKTTPVDLSIPIEKLNSELKDYRILSEVGRGGMGVVYKAWQIGLERPVALKVLPGILGAIRPESVSRFRREAALAAQLKHTNIISVYDCGQIDGTLYYAMELIEGYSLADFVQTLRARKNKRSSPENILSFEPSQDYDDPPLKSGIQEPPIISEALTPETRSSKQLLSKSYYRYVAERLAEVAEALFYAHSLGVIHRDIKPSNLLIASDGRIMIADFGLAVRPDTSATASCSSVVGTYRYMSPEVLDNSRGVLDHRADVYALGATIYELLTLRPMLPVTQDHDVLLDILNRDPVAPRSLSPNLPKELELICLKAVAKDPNQRYQSAKDLADDLHRWLLDLPIVAKRPSPMSRMYKFARRHRVSAIGGTIILILLVTTVVLSSAAHSARTGAERLVKDARDQSMERALFESICDLVTGRTDSSIKKVSAVVEAYPNRVKPRLARAFVFSFLDRLDEAIHFAKETVARHPDCSPAKHLTAVLESRKNGVDPPTFHPDENIPGASDDDPEVLFLYAFVETDPNRAVQILNKALEKNPSHVASIILRCLVSSMLGEYDHVLRDADRIFSYHPNWSLGCGMRGMALDALGQWQQAKRSLDRAIALDPNQAQWLVVRSHVKLVYSDYQSAIDDASRAIAIDSSLNQAFLARSAALAESKEYTQAIEDMTTIIERNPDSGYYYYRRSQVYRLAGLFDEELADLAIATKLDPLHTDILMRNGQSHLGLKDYEQAIVAFSRALNLQPDNPPIRFRRAMAYELSEEYRQALGDYERLTLASAPVRDYANIFRYLLLIQIGDEENANSALESIKARDGEWLGHLCSFLAGRLTEEELLDRSKTKTQRCEAFYYAARVDMNMGNKNNAMTSFQNCAALDPGGKLEPEFARLFIKRLSGP